MKSETPARARIWPGKALSPRRGFAVVLALVIGFECAQSMMALIKPSDFEKSYWLVNYDFGFVRRGLGGEVLQLLGGGEVSTPLILAAIWSTALLPVAALAGLVILLVRRGTTASIAVAALIVCSPWTFEALWRYHRPDQYGLVAMIVVGLVIVATSRGRTPRLVWLALIGLAMGVLVFVHEASMVLWGVGALVLVALAHEPARWRMWAAVVLLSPAMVASVVVLAAGRAEPSVVDRLMSQPASQAYPAVVEHGEVLVYLDDTLADSVRRVADIAVKQQALMAAWILATVVIHAAWLIASRISGRRVDWLTGAALAGMALAGIFVFATGVDWIRWGCSLGTIALVIIAFHLLSLQPGIGRTQVWTGQLELWMVAVGVYLATRQLIGPDGIPQGASMWGVLPFIKWWL
jgi:hypothetical protein